MKKIILIISIIIIGNVSMIKAQNTSYGSGALNSNTTGNYNSAFAYQALHANTTGSSNSAFGYQALHSNISGNYNTANGYLSLGSNNTGNYNTANGYLSLASNTTGNYNTSYGVYSLCLNTTGYCNIAGGYLSLYKNINGNYNTAYGYYSLFSNTSGVENTAIGSNALLFNTSGNFNVADGESALMNNITGNSNTAVGFNSLKNSTTGDNNTAIGLFSGYNVTTYSNTTSIGYNATAIASNQVRIGNSSVTSIGGQVSWTTLSDGRFKKEIKHDVPGLEFINKLEPVSYIIDKNAFDDFLKIPDSLRIKNNNAPITQSGFIAQDVEKILQEMNISNFNGVDLPKNENDYYGIRYAEFVVPLVKSVQELSALDKENKLKIGSLEEKIKNLEKIIIDAGLVSNVNTATQLQSDLDQNNPNPFNSSTEIKCFVPSNATTAMLMIFDMNGKQVKTISITERGDCLVKVNAAELKGSGMYIYSLFIDNKEISTKRMILSE